MSSTPLRTLLAASFLLIASERDAAAFLARDRLQMDADIILNGTAQPPRVECSASDAPTGHATRTWRLEVGGPVPPTKADPAPGVAARCLTTAAAGTIAAPDPAATPPILLIDVTTTGDFEIQMEGEPVLVLKVAWVAKRLSGHDDRGRPIYTSSENGRTLFFSDESEIVLPLAVAGPSDGAAVVFREVVMRFRVTTPLSGSNLYGAIAVTSPARGAAVLLDGGLAGMLAETGQATLRNVAAGLHDVAVRDASGATSRRPVHVRAGRTALVEIGRPGAPPVRPALRLVPKGRNEAGFEEFERPIDGGVVVRIPAGEFLMGNTETERSPREHCVHVSEFLMDRTGVTWGQYRKFAAANAISLPLHTPYWGMFDDHPANYVTWEEAKAYCEWAGGRLPTEAEREKAARGTDDRKYPWGDEEPTPERGVYRHTWGHVATGAVGTHPAGASPYGLQDMGGNVWEWCSDWYSGEYYDASPARDPRGPEEGRAHVVRGGSWDSRPTVLSASCRSWGHRGYREGDFGFRCAMNSPGAAGDRGEAAAQATDRPAPCAAPPPN